MLLVNVWDSETNLGIFDATVTMDGINYTTPFIELFPSGTALIMLAYSPGYTIENRTILVQDTSSNGAATQTFNFLLSRPLVRIFYFQAM